MSASPTYRYYERGTRRVWGFTFRETDGLPWDPDRFQLLIREQAGATPRVTIDDGDAVVTATSGRIEVALSDHAGVQALTPGRYSWAVYVWETAQQMDPDRAHWGTLQVLPEGRGAERYGPTPETTESVYVVTTGDQIITTQYVEKPGRSVAEVHQIDAGTVALLDEQGVEIGRFTVPPGVSDFALDVANNEYVLTLTDGTELRAPAPTSGGASGLAFDFTQAANSGYLALVN